MGKIVESILELRNISKSFPGVRALDHVSFSLQPGEVHALVGENGAGKSTLIMIISGAYRADAGDIFWEGQRISYNSPMQALEFGIGCIYQEFNLIPQLTVAENISLGQIPTNRWKNIDRDEMHRRAKDVLAMLEFDLDTRLPISRLNVAQQQIVEICKALSHNPRVLIMDEPTAALNNMETEHLFQVIKTLRAKGVAIIYISHRLREVFEVADRVTVLKDGQNVETKLVKDVTEDELVRMMVGRKLEDLYPPKNTATSRTVMRADAINLKGSLQDISFELHAGEILGVAGLEGMGQRELVHILAGANPPSSGRIYIEGRLVEIHNPSEALLAGISFIPDDRKKEGLILIRSIRENMALPSLDRRISGIVIDERQERNFVGNLIESLGIRVSSQSQVARDLSGGNQQKVIVAKCIGTAPKVLVLAEPTRGIDVGSKSEIHHLIRQLAGQGVAVLMVSSELPEILGMSDRILVMAHGQIVAEMPGESATEEAIMFAATSEIDTARPEGKGN